MDQTPPRDPELETKLLYILRSGNTPQTAAIFAGITEEQLSAYLQIHSEFRKEFYRTQNDVEIRNVAAIEASIKKNPQAAMWWLETRRPETWGRNEPPQTERYRPERSVIMNDVLPNTPKSPKRRRKKAD